jgi:polygalacturonase
MSALNFNQQRDKQPARIRLSTLSTMRCLRLGFTIAFVLLLRTNVHAAGPFNILDYGAHNDGSAPATEAIRSAIQAAKAAGGGTVYIPAGQYVSGPIELVSNLVLNIDAGAIVHFPAARLPLTAGRQQGIECLTPVPLIGGRNLENVTITGRGVLTSDNAEWMKLMPRQKSTGADPGSANGPNWEHLLQALEVKTPASKEDYEKAAPELRPSFVRFMDSKNVLVEGVHFVGSPMWTVHLLYSDNVTVRGVIIETYPGVHTDGIGIDSSRNVRISDCYIDTGDDGIVIKSGKDADGLRVNRPSENITITNCTVHHAHGAVTIGSETSGSIRNVVASNIVCDGTEIGVRIKSRVPRGGVVEDLRFDGWTMRNVGQGINVTNFYQMEGEAANGAPAASNRIPVFRSIAISRMTIDGARVAISVEGLAEMPISGLRISDVIANARVGVRVYGTTGLELHNVRINAQTGPAFLVRDSTELELDHISGRQLFAQLSSGTPVVRLDHCPGAILRSSKAAPGTGTFLSAGPGELKGVALEGNVLGSARRATEEVDGEFWKAVAPAPERPD